LRSSTLHGSSFDFRTRLPLGRTFSRRSGWLMDCFAPVRGVETQLIFRRAWFIPFCKPPPFLPPLFFPFGPVRRVSFVWFCFFFFFCSPLSGRCGTFQKPRFIALVSWAVPFCFSFRFCREKRFFFFSPVFFCFPSYSVFFSPSIFQVHHPRQLDVFLCGDPSSYVQQWTGFAFLFFFPLS